MFITLRKIGEVATSQEEMPFNVTLMHVIFTNGDLLESDYGRNNLPYPAVRYFRGIKLAASRIPWMRRLS